MDKKTKLIYSALIVIVLFGLGVTLKSPEINFNQNIINKPHVPIACTADAKQCPDGSYVGRSGPKCEFEKCPDFTTNSLKLGQTVILSELKVTPIKVVQDSRCPIGVQCIQAGTLIVKTKFEILDNSSGQSEAKELDIELGKPFDIYGKWAELKDASSKEKGYTFSFIIKNYER